MSEARMAEIAATAARLVVEQGLDYGAAKRRALKQLKLPARTALPDNPQVEAEVRDYLALFCADSQPMELRVLRGLAAEWMRRLQEFRPYLAGAVWHGTATRHTPIELQLFCDDPKSAEISLINLDLRYEVGSMRGWTGELVDVLGLQLRGPSESVLAQSWVALHLAIYDHDDLRGALKPDSQGRAARGDLAALERLLAAPAPS
jgi:hypothetical protein